MNFFSIISGAAENINMDEDNKLMNKVYEWT
jgi:hypothetical protein